MVATAGSRAGKRRRRTALVPIDSATSSAVDALVTDTDPDEAALIAFALRRSGYNARGASDAASLLPLLDGEAPALLVLDTELYGNSGIEALEAVRSLSSHSAVVLTGRGDEDARVAGLEAGAVDYLSKPFSSRELAARLRALLRLAAGRQGDARPASQPDQTVMRVGPLVLNTATHSATRAGMPLCLTATQFRLLHSLMANAGTVVPSAQLLREVWDAGTPRGTDLLRTNVHRLRRKIEACPHSPMLLHTVPGVGFLLQSDRQESDWYADSAGFATVTQIVPEGEEEPFSPGDASGGR